MAEEKIDWAQLVLKEAIRAGTWGIVLLIILVVFLSAVKRDIKEAIDFGAKRAVFEATSYATDPYLIGKGKQLFKEGIEYSVEKAGAKYKAIIQETMPAKRLK